MNECDLIHLKHLKLPLSPPNESTLYYNLVDSMYFITISFRFVGQPLRQFDILQFPSFSLDPIETALKEKRRSQIFIFNENDNNYYKLQEIILIYSYFKLNLF